MPKNRHTQRIFFKKNPLMTYGSSKSAKIVLSKSIFSFKNQPNFSNFFFSSKNIILGDHFLVKAFFSKLNFSTTLFPKITPNFWRTDSLRRNFFEHFLWLILSQKSYFLGPTIFEIPQPNWHMPISLVKIHIRGEFLTLKRLDCLVI